MPIPVSYPGVYIQEIPSGVHTIVGVATSIAAFVGQARMGPVGSSVVCNGFGDFGSSFGGLWSGNPLSYAVRDFFQNGGAQAIIVRLFNSTTVPPPPNPQTTPPTTYDPNGQANLTFATVPGLTLLANSPGTWGNFLSVVMDTIGITTEVATLLGLPAALVGQIFNLTTTFADPVSGITSTEKISNLTVIPSSRQISAVLPIESSFLLCNAVPPGTTITPPTAPQKAPSTVTVNGWDSNPLQPTDYVPTGGAPPSSGPYNGIYVLEQADLFNLLCIPPDNGAQDIKAGVLPAALTYCAYRRAMLLVDPPSGWHKPADAVAGVTSSSLGLTGIATRNAALYYPRIQEPDPLSGNQPVQLVPCGAVAGLMAQTDATRGVWKAPAGLDAAIGGIQGLTYKMTDMENGQLNPLGINCLRTFPVAGSVVWGARTMRGADQLSDDYKYVPVRRLALYIEESLYRGTKWVVFEPNDEPLWAQIRLNVGSFMQTLFRQGAFQGQSAQDAYFVKCDKETTTQSDINLGIVNIVVGFAPLKPAEFVVISIQQMAGQLTT